LTIFLGILSFFLILAVLVLVHEAGHFGAAKLFGVRVEEFGIGFPPRVKTWRRRGTLYSLNAIPLGGFVRMLGENGDDSEPSAFGAHPPWQRFIILAAGPVMNIALAFAIFFFVFTLGSPRTLSVVTSVAPGSPAHAAKLLPGDRITAVDSRSVHWADELVTMTNQHLGQDVQLRVVRRGHLFSATLFARPADRRPTDQGPLGIGVSQTAIVSYSPTESAGRAASSVWAMVAGLPAFIRSIGQHGGAQVTGPIGIAHITTQTVQQEPQEGPGVLLYLMALLSVNLGVLNLFPIPALDGGRLVFVLISWIRRRNLDPQLEGVIHLVGMALLLLLILVVSYQDIARWAGGGSF